MVRPRQDQDLDRCIAVLRKVYESDGYPSNWPRAPARWLAGMDTIAAWVAEDSGELVGHVALSTPDPDRSWPEWREALDLPAESLAVVRRLFVAPSARRAGVGTALVRCAQQEASRRGLHPVLDVSDDNHAAIAFWKRHGWRSVGEATLPRDEAPPLQLLLLVSSR